MFRLSENKHRQKHEARANLGRCSRRAPAHLTAGRTLGSLRTWGGAAGVGWCAGPRTRRTAGPAAAGPAGRTWNFHSSDSGSGVSSCPAQWQVPRFFTCLFVSSQHKSFPIYLIYNIPWPKIRFPCKEVYIWIEECRRCRAGRPRSSPRWTRGGSCPRSGTGRRCIGRGSPRRYTGSSQPSLPASLNRKTVL